MRAESVEALYRQLGAQVASMPKFFQVPPTMEEAMWLAKAHALVEASAGLAESLAFKNAWDRLGQSVFAPEGTNKIRDVLLRALAKIELQAPVSAQGAFIAAGAKFDAFQAIGKALGEAESDVLIIDPYMDDRALLDFVPLVAEGINVRIVSDATHTKWTTALRGGLGHWATQYGSKRPLAARLAAAGALHDRVMIIDGGTTVWSLTQSLKDFALKSPGSLLKVDAELAALKTQHFEQVWASATPI